MLLSSDLSWSAHVKMITTKARRVLGLFYRMFYRHLSSCKLLSLYVAQVRPILEYGAVVWDPFLKKDRFLLECTQKFALRMCLKDWNLYYSSLLCSSHLPSLADRRKYLKLCILFKFIHQLASSPTSFELRHRDSRFGFTQYKLMQPFARTNSYLYSFLPSTIHLYNDLPLDILCVVSFSVFKSSLRLYLLFFVVIFLFVFCCFFFGGGGGGLLFILWAHFVLAFGYCVSCAVHKLIKIKLKK